MDTLDAIRTVKTFSKEREHLDELKSCEKAATEADANYSLMNALEVLISSITDRITYSLVLLFSFLILQHEVNSLSAGKIGAFILFYQGLFEFIDYSSILHKSRYII